MNARELAGAVMMTGIPGLDLDEKTRRALTELRPSGVILFRRNVENVAQLRALTAALHQLPSRPIVAIDHEGGAVMRLGPPFTQFPPARWIARCGDPELARAVGRAMAVELTSVGIDLDFAPVLDVDSNPGNPIIGERAFGSTPEEVARYALPFIDGLRSGGLIPCGKHFPGHGDTDRDSHLELPVVRRDRETLERTELAPFRAAIAAGIPLIMTAHVLYPALDPDVPATLSRPILHDLLRGQLGFRGVIASDDLEMKGISGDIPVPEVAVRSLHAGADWLLVCNHFDLALQTADRVAAALADGSLDAPLLAAAGARVAALRAAPTNPLDVALPLAEHEALNTRIRRAAT